MNRFIICSDIHGNLSDFKRMLREAGRDPIDGVIIAGDMEIDQTEIQQAVSVLKRDGKPVSLYMVKGNCDYEFCGDLKDLATIQLPGNITCVLSHGHRYQVKSDLMVYAEVARNLGAKIAIYGHTHLYDDRMLGNIRFINPGALCGSRYDRPSYILMTIYDGKVDIVKCNLEY